MTILNDEKILNNDIKTDVVEDKQEKVGVAPQEVSNEQDIINNQEKQDREAFDRFKQIQAEQKAMGINAKDQQSNNKHITEIFQERARNHFNNYEEAEKFLELLNLNKDAWEVEEKSFLTPEAKTRYADRMFNVFNQISEGTNERARKEHEFCEWKLDRDLGSETSKNIKLLAAERFVQATGLDMESFNKLPYSQKDVMYRKIHQEHCDLLKSHSEKVSAEIKDPKQAAAMRILRDKGLA